eukprot:Gb_36614 [translate_table: standard]
MKMIKRLIISKPQWLSYSQTLLWSYMFINDLHIHIPIFIHVKGGVIHQSISTATVDNGQPEQNPKWETEGGSVASIAVLLQGCTNTKEVEQVHTRLLTIGLDENIFLLTRLVGLYAMCGTMDNARLVFDKLQETDVVMWNVMIRGYVRNRRCEEALSLYYRMQLAGINPDKFTFPCVLNACASLSAIQEGKEIHNHVLVTGFQSDVFVGNSLIAMYAKCGAIELARLVFDKMPKRDVVSWNAMTVGYAQNGHANEALILFDEMRLVDVIPDSVTMVSVLTACAHLGDLEQGKWFHKSIISSGLESSVFVGTALIDMYAKCGSVELARQVFEKMSLINVITWNAMISGCTQNGQAWEALTLFNQLQLMDVKPNSATFGIVLQACAQLQALQQGEWIHDYINRTGYKSDVFVETALLDMYAKCGRIEIARLLFDNMSRRNVVSWNAMIAGYVQTGYANDALTLFNKMKLADVKPNLATIMGVLPACAQLAALQQGKWIHGYIIQSGHESDVYVCNSLIDMYAKCGSIEVARQLFDRMSERNVVSWSAMIAGYGMHGYGEDALALFSQMQETGMKPNHITFVSVLYACSHAGLVDEGCYYFDTMSRHYHITPRMEHFACMVDLLGRAGHLDEAQDFIKRMPVKPDAGVWRALLGSCRIHCNIVLGEHVANQLLDLEHENAGIYVLLSNIYAAAGRWEDVAKVRTMMNERGLKKAPGCSSIEVNNRIHSFLSGDRSHPQSEKIYQALEILGGQMKEVGYVPNTSFVLHDVEEKVKKHMLCSHSEASHCFWAYQLKTWDHDSYHKKPPCVW